MSEQPEPGTGTAFITPINTWVATSQDDDGRVKHSDELPSEGLAVAWAVNQGAAKIIVNRDDEQVTYTREQAEAVAHNRPEPDG
jgi:hypothetical protein